MRHPCRRDCSTGLPEVPGQRMGRDSGRGLYRPELTGEPGGGRAPRRPQQHDSPRHLVAHLHWDACDAASNSPAEDTDAAKTGSRVVSEASRSPAAASSVWREDLNRSSHDAKLTRVDLVGGNSGSAPPREGLWESGERVSSALPPRVACPPSLNRENVKSCPARTITVAAGNIGVARWRRLGC